jgi:hypothetical protein
MVPPPSKILVEILADNDRSRNTIEFAIRRHGDGKIDVGQSSNSLLAVADCEGRNSKADLSRYHRRYPQRPVVLMLPSAQERSFLDGDLADLDAEVVVKPIKVDDMIRAIKKCAERSSKPELTRFRMEATRLPATETLHVVPPPEPVKTEIVEQDNDEATIALPGGFLGVSKDQKTVFHAGDIDLRDAAIVDRTRFSAADCLLGRLGNAVRQMGETDVALVAEIDSQPLFRLEPDTDQISVLVAPESLPHWAAQVVPEKRFALRPDMSPTREPGEGNRLSCEALLWRLALLTYRGMIPEDTNPLDRVFLIRWPNVTRLDPVPDSLRIAALWSRMPVSLDFTARTLSIPQKHVFLFYAAARTIGLAGPERRASNSIFKPESQQSIIPHALLVRLAGYLAKGGVGTPAEESQ